MESVGLIKVNRFVLNFIRNDSVRLTFVFAFSLWPQGVRTTMGLSSPPCALFILSLFVLPLCYASNSILQAPTMSLPTVSSEQSGLAYPGDVGSTSVVVDGKVRRLKVRI